MVTCLQRLADMHMAQLMPLPLTVSCFSKIQIGLPFWYRLTWVVPDKGPLNVCACVRLCVLFSTTGAATMTSPAVVAAVAARRRRASTTTSSVADPRTSSLFSSRDNTNRRRKTTSAAELRDGIHRQNGAFLSLLLTVDRQGSQSVVSGDVIGRRATSADVICVT